MSEKTRTTIFFDNMGVVESVMVAPIFSAGVTCRTNILAEQIHV